MAQVHEQAFIQRLIAHQPVETLGVTVQHEFARADVVRGYVVVGDPLEDGIRDQLCSVVISRPAGRAGPKPSVPADAKSATAATGKAVGHYLFSNPGGSAPGPPNEVRT
jgi:hypothetical protein